MQFPRTFLCLAVIACDPGTMQTPSDDGACGDGPHRHHVQPADECAAESPRTATPPVAPAHPRIATPSVAPAHPRTDTPPAAPARKKLVLHEWGTFTAVAGADGTAVKWRPLTAPSDLPAFVYSPSRPGFRQRGGGKGSMSGTVRMETPVIYFYVDEPQQVALSVGFEQGALTEWYPQVQSWSWGQLDWGRFLVAPATAANRALIPEADVAGHYHAARATDAAVVRVCAPERDEHEKFLFYRGVGTFDLSLTARLEQDTLALRTRGAAVPAIVFERRGDLVGFAEARVGDTGVSLARPTLDRDLPAVLARLEALLVQDGLYPREAQAMIATWRDHWFEDGLRVFYLLPRPEIDALLPLKVDPAPTELARTIVGRIEVITPELERRVRTMVTRPGADPTALCKTLREQHGRFAEPVLRRVADGAPGQPAAAALAACTSFE